MVKKFDIIGEIFIIFLMIVMSYQSIFSKYCAFLDEFIILFLLIFSLILIFLKKKDFEIKQYIFISGYIVLTAITALIRQYNFLMYIVEILNYVKIIILFESLKTLKIERERLNRLIKYFVIINIPSILCGIYQILRFLFTDNATGFMYRNNKIRIEGLAGHPIILGMIGVILFYFSLSNMKSIKKDVKHLMICILSVAIVILTGSRFPLVLLAIIILYELYFRLKEKYSINSKIILKIMFCIILISLVLVAINYKKIGAYIYNEKSSIRIYSLTKVPEILIKYPILGTGIGTYSCRASIQYNSTVYEEFNFSKDMIKFATENISSGFESHLAKQLIETGILGTLLYYGYFINFLYVAINKKNKNVILFVSIVLLNSIINQIYSIPLILIVGILISNMYLEQEEINENNNINTNI